VVVKIMRAALITGLAILFAVGCGGKEGERPSADYQPSEGDPPPSDPCLADDGLEFDAITDFENGIAQRWWTSDDGSPNATITPPSDRESPDANELPDPRCGESTYALRIRAEGLAIYGAAFGLSFLVEDPLGRDASDWEGLSMWVKRNGDGVGTSLFASVSDRNTDSSARASIQSSELQQEIETDEIVPDCNDDSLVESQKCDRFGAGVLLPNEWTFVRIPFDRMKQRGYGVPAPALDVGALAGLNFGVEVGDWDFYVDDVAFYRAAGGANE
jgi:hypothetical protein